MNPRRRIHFISVTPKPVEFHKYILKEYYMISHMSKMGVGRETWLLQRAPASMPCQFLGFQYTQSTLLLCVVLHRDHDVSVYFHETKLVNRSSRTCGFKLLFPTCIKIYGTCVIGCNVSFGSFCILWSNSHKFGSYFIFTCPYH